MRCGHTGKVRHASHAAAWKAKATVRREKGIVLKAYRCPDCGGWHLGNNRGTRLVNLGRAFDRAHAMDAKEKGNRDEGARSAP